MDNEVRNPLVALATRAVFAEWDDERFHMEVHRAGAGGLTPEDLASAVEVLQHGGLKGTVRNALHRMLLSILLVSEDATLWRERFGVVSLVGLTLAVRGVSPDGRPAQANHCFHFGNALYNAGLLDEAEQALRLGVDLYRTLQVVRPEIYEYRAGFADCLNNLANTLSALNREVEAGALHLEALAVQRILARSGAPTDRSSLAASLNNLGTSLSRQGHFREAEAHLAETLALYRSLATDDAGFESDVVMALTNLGQNLCEQRRFGDAETFLREAARMGRGLTLVPADDAVLRDSDHTEQSTAAHDYAQVLAALGTAILEQGRFHEAEDMFRDAVALQPNLMPGWGSLGAALFKQRRYRESETAMRRALDLHERLGNIERGSREDQVAAIHDNLGLVLYEQSRHLEAEQEHRGAIAIYRRLNKRSSEAFLAGLADALHNLANPLLAQRRFGDAESALREGLGIYQHFAKQTPHVYAPDVAIMHLSLGNVLAAEGRVQEGEETYREAEGLARQLVAEQSDIYRPLLAMVLNNLGAMLIGQRRWPESERLLEEAAELRRVLAADRPESYLPLLGTTLTNLGNLRRDLARFGQAARDLEEAERIYRGLVTRDRGAYLPDLARTLLNLGSVFHHQRHLAEAERALRECASCNRELAAQLPAAYEPLLAAGLINLANVLGNTESGPARNPAEAGQLYHEALALDPENLGGARLRGLVGLARLAVIPTRAYPLYKQALVELAERRGTLPYLEDRRALHGEYQFVYDEMIQCCVSLGRRAEAWWWAEQARSASLRDLLGSARPRLKTADDVRLYERWQEAQADLFEEERGYRDGREETRLGVTQFPRAVAPDETEARVGAVRAARRREADLRRRVLGQLDRVRELKQAQVPQPWQLIALLQGLTRQNGATQPNARPLLIAYHLLDLNRYVVFLVPLWDRAADRDWAGGEPIEAHTVAQPVGTLLDLLLQFETAQESVSRAVRGSDESLVAWAAWEALPSMLGQALVQPWADRLQHLRPTTLIVSASGPLQLLPLHAAEHRPGVPLIADYPIVCLPNAAMARNLVRRRKLANRPDRRLVLGPPGNDLPASLVEAQILAREWGHFAGGPGPETAPYMRERMRIDVLRAHTRQTAVVHLSTHAQFDRHDYLRSAILFHNEELTLAQVISDASIDLEGCRLCFLNSCHGARVLPDAGDELPGLLWALIYAGAEAVIASLWSVDDGAAAQLALTLYEKWQEPGQTLATAYREAVLHVREERKSPYYWAPFILAGNAFVEAPPLRQAEARR